MTQRSAVPSRKIAQAISDPPAIALIARAIRSRVVRLQLAGGDRPPSAAPGSRPGVFLDISSVCSWNSGSLMSIWRNASELASSSGVLRVLGHHRRGGDHRRPAATSGCAVAHHVEAGVASVAAASAESFSISARLEPKRCTSVAAVTPASFATCRQRQLDRAEPRHHADGGVDQVLVGDGSGAGGHGGLTDYKRSFTLAACS